MNTISDNIKRLRKKSGMTQDELAEKMHVTRQAISNWETGKNQPDIDTLAALAEAFTTDINDLLYGNKKNEYPRYQRKYKISVSVCCAVVLLFLILQTTVLPDYSGFNINFFAVYLNLISYVASAVALGYGIPSVFSLWFDCSVKRSKLCLALAIIALIPAILLMLYFAPFNGIHNSFLIKTFSEIIRRTWLRSFALKILPCVSGVLFFLGIDNLVYSE